MILLNLGSNQKYCYDKCSSKANLIQPDAAAERLGFKTRKELCIVKWITCPLCGGRLYLVRSELLWKYGNEDCSFQKKDNYKHKNCNHIIF